MLPKTGGIALSFVFISKILQISEYTTVTVGKPNWFKLVWDWLWTPTFNPLNMTSDNKSVLAFNLSYLFEKADIFLP